jgi:hypothetical protein
VLTNEQIEEYKSKELHNDDELLKRLKFLKTMLEEDVITPAEYDKKKTELIKSL